DLEKRDIFLLTTLIIVLTEFLKVTDYIGLRYRRERLQLMTDQQTIMTPYNPEKMPPKKVTAGDVRNLNSMLFRFTKQLSDLQHDLHSVNIARNVIHQQLETHE